MRNFVEVSGREFSDLRFSSIMFRLQSSFKSVLLIGGGGGGGAVGVGEF